MCLRIVCFVAIVVSFLLNHMVNGACHYSLDMKFGSDYYMTSPMYPLLYPPNTQCTYRINAPFGYRINFTCQDFQIPSSLNCKYDALYVSYSGKEDLSDAYIYCGAGVIREKSIANTMYLRLQAAPTSRGGKFLCSMSLISQSCSCGKKKTKRIVNGVETMVNEFPMMAAMIDVEERSIICGATIIAENYAITAAHCVLQRTIDDTVLLVGDHNLTTGSDTPYARPYVLAQFLAHPGFSNRPVSNDIALIRTLQRIQYNDGVGPVCLPWKFRANNFDGAVVEACGWGHLDFGGPGSNVLNKVALDVISNRDCSERLNSTVAYQKMCTYTPLKDTCQFDSGGPLFYTEPGSGLVYEVAIVSYGFGCASRSPSVNTRVTEYLDWIMANSPDTFYCFQ
ncbi:venom serine protease-like [Toxorhynchites rutilus septentrionalis]|uniref:venom serine protease-like n=1 Tax=Toxorhynchites rutilus septentrionalis TaxID=329112 RepID=UPI002479169D|nr:venom serine protease-like [Toxorhynchites rutilus septentrionalis]